MSKGVHRGKLLGVIMYKKEYIRIHMTLSGVIMYQREYKKDEHGTLWKEDDVSKEIHLYTYDIVRDNDI